MQKIVVACLLTVFLANAVGAQEQEAVAKTRIVSVAIFKSGLTGQARSASVRGRDVSA